jgi:hypothetical protein
VQVAFASADRKAMEEFKGVARELKQILEKAMRELRQQNCGAGSTALSAVPAIPASITV